MIALAAVIGKCLMDSGAADRTVRSFLSVLGQRRASWALMGSGFVLSVPVFFDTVFYLPVLLPIVLMSSNTVVKAIGGDTEIWQQVGQITAVLGNRDLALLLSAGIAIGLLVVWRRLSLKDFGKSIEAALMSGGVIILITAADGAPKEITVYKAAFARQTDRHLSALSEAARKRLQAILDGI